jgi:hypothetical protein
MKYENLILISEICTHYRVEQSFFELLDQHDLLERIYYEDKYYIEVEYLARFEKIIRFKNDLNINLEGISVIFELLEKIDRLQEENIRLQNRLQIFE